jgi:hypothetical protein
VPVAGLLSRRNPAFHDRDAYTSKNAGFAIAIMGRLFAARLKLAFNVVPKRHTGAA